MIIDGNAIAQKIFNVLEQKIMTSRQEITLGVFVVGSDYVTERFVSLKKKKAKDIGIHVDITHLPFSTTTQELVQNSIYWMASPYSYRFQSILTLWLFLRVSRYTEISTYFQQRAALFLRKGNLIFFRQLWEQ